jgi:hypothetical protein
MFEQHRDRGEKKEDWLTTLSFTLTLETNSAGVNKGRIFSHSTIFRKFPGNWTRSKNACFMFQNKVAINRNFQIYAYCEMPL